MRSATVRNSRIQPGLKRHSWCLLLATAVVCQGAGVTLSISPSTQSAPVGSQVSFDVNVSGLGGGTQLGAYDVTFNFNPALMSYVTTSFGNQLNLSGLGDIRAISPGSGTVEITEVSLDSVSTINSSQSSSFRLFTLTFNAVAGGSNSPLTLSLNTLGDAVGNPISATAQSASVTIVGTGPPPPPTPAPPSWFLAAIGLILLGILAWRNRALRRA
jgi:hypothetical protein